RSGLSLADVSTLLATTTVPFPRHHAETLLERCETILVLEELEPYFERDLIVLAHEMGFEGRIVGKLDGTLSRIGEYGLAEIVEGIEACGTLPVEREKVPQATGHALRAAQQLVAARPITVCAGVGRPQGADDLTGEPPQAVLPVDELAAPRPITVCAGCPHRGTYLAIDAAIREAGFEKDEVMVTGDIGCTILGMNPPFDLLWNEVSMGSSLGIAQGYAHAGPKTPVIATIGDSTFFHGGISGLINAIQHRVPLTLVVMDNGWTAMTGMQINPGTDEEQQAGARRVDLEAVIRGLGPDRVTVVDPYDLEVTTGAIVESLGSQDGVGVVIARRECAIQASRRKVSYGTVTVDPEECVLCKQCLRVTGCPALSLPVAAKGLGSKPPGESPEGKANSPRAESIEIDSALCNGCGICVSFCPTSAIKKEAT
ncbi:thiamine pyrophosphate-dependent enzyme, partial [Candidatus Bipolaricaulota bacterium]